tara:strand:+ start:1968 stop:2354 length:387 start_codon:yes stop_codon:yes gene_type:complete
MSVTVSNVANPLGTLLVTDTEANGTAEENATGATGIIYSVQIDNTLNTAGVYVKIADNAMAGTTSQDQAPHYVYYAPAGETVTYACPGGSAYATALSFWCTTVKASFHGVNETQTDPLSNVNVKILTT